MPTADHVDTRFAPRLHACQRQPGPVTRALAAMRNEPPLSPEAEADLAAGCDALDEVLRRAATRDHHEPASEAEWEAEWEAAGRELALDLADLIADAGKTKRVGGGL